MPRGKVVQRKKFCGLVDPRLAYECPSIFLSFKNHTSWFVLGLALRDGMNVVIPHISTTESIQTSLTSFGFVIRDEEPNDHPERPLDEPYRTQFKFLKNKILANLVKLFCDEELHTKHDFIIRCVPELSHCGMVRSAYLQLMFHTREDADAMMATL